MTVAPAAAPDLLVSLSSQQTFQACEQRYSFNYVDGYRPKLRDIPPERGTIIHDAYLGTYYDALKAGDKAAIAHERALATVEATRPKTMEWARTAHAMGKEDVMNGFLGLTDMILRVCERYYQTHGYEDSYRYEPLLIEHWVDVEIDPGSDTLSPIRSVGRVDMVATDLETGRLTLWENKTTEHVPPEEIRLMDLQTLLYCAKLGSMPEMIEKFPKQHGMPDSVVWNYFRMKEPVVPETLKNGGVSKRKDIDSTWEVYSAAVTMAGDDPDAPIYDELRARLTGREQKVFFPRYERVTRIDPQKVLRSYIAQAKVMRARRAAWETGKYFPILTLGRNCEWCSFGLLCKAELMGGDLSDVVKRHYSTPEDRKRKEVVGEETRWEIA